MKSEAEIVAEMIEESKESATNNKWLEAIDGILNTMRNREHEHLKASEQAMLQAKAIANERNAIEIFLYKAGLRK